ncbi:GerMN domain-containing protein [Tumidithrix helvetica PCC 7403]|uniref:GerMN domain-containing protein n=1 Tax=Tumidithrix helvetica TaxID=3457545 RepID=UPI003CB3DEA5
MRIPALQNKVWLGLAAVAVIGGASTAAIVGSLSQQPPTTKPPVVTQVTPTTAPQAIEQQVSVYWIKSKQNKLVAVPTAIKAANTEAALKEALAKMLAEPTKEATFYSAIPKNTRILDFSVSGKDIRLNLSKEFKSGGGTSSMQGRVIQILYTATSLDPAAKLYLSVEGKPLAYLGGEGLEIPQPLTRKDFGLEF